MHSLCSFILIAPQRYTLMSINKEERRSNHTHQNSKLSPTFIINVDSAIESISKGLNVIEGVTVIGAPRALSLMYSQGSRAAKDDQKIKKMRKCAISAHAKPTVDMAAATLKKACRGVEQMAR